MINRLQHLFMTTEHQFTTSRTIYMFKYRVGLYNIPYIDLHNPVEE